MDVEALFRDARIEVAAAQQRSFAYYDETLKLRLRVSLPEEVEASAARTVLASPALSFTLEFGYIDKNDTDSSVPRLSLPVPPKRDISPTPSTPLPIPSTSPEDQTYANVQPLGVSSTVIDGNRVEFEVHDGRLTAIYELEGFVSACVSTC